MNAFIPTILYVDDDSDDCTFLAASFAAAQDRTDLVYASSGDEAIRYLHAQGTVLPSLIILDLNMPRRDGKQTLSYIKADPSLSHIPVVILSTSQSQTDQEVCAQLGASSYLVKPNRYDGYNTIVDNCMTTLYPSK